MEKKVLKTKNVSISFPGVKALDDINFEVETGEIRAVVGANGAGKSTLMKVLAGANPTYEGEVLLNDKVVDLRTPIDAKKIGIQIVYQEVDTSLVPTLSVAENIMINEMVMSGGFRMDWKNTREEAKKALARLHINNIDVNTLVQNLTLAQKQMVLIARAVRMNCNFLILDEPTAPLSASETKELFEVVKHLRETENLAIMFISHRLNEIIEILRQEGVLGIDLLHTRMFGNKIYVDLEISADGEKPLKETHAIAENVHDSLEINYPQIKHIMVHVNPKE